MKFSSSMSITVGTFVGALIVLADEVAPAVPKHDTVIFLQHHLSSMISERSPQPDAQAPPYLQPNAYLCDGVGFHGNCLLVAGYDHVCWSLARDASWDRRVAAFGPDQGLSCTIFTSAECGLDAAEDDDQLTLEYPGVADLGQVGFGGRMQSWICAPL